jgi:DNA-binding NarL/FixJ family response regulator
MPDPGGVEIAKRLAGAGSKTSVILFTGYPDRALLLEALDAGARGFLVKESPLPDLARAMRLVASGGTYVDPLLSSVLVGAGAADRLPALTKREREILRLLANGMRNEAVGAQLGISPLTVRTHIRHAMDKLEADTRTEAVATALRQALID